MASLYCTLPGLHWIQNVAKELEFFHLKWRAAFSDPHFLRWLMLFSYIHLAPESITGLKADHIEMLGFTDWAVEELHKFIKVHDDMGQIYVFFSLTLRVAVCVDGMEPCLYHALTYDCKGKRLG